MTLFIQKPGQACAVGSSAVDAKRFSALRAWALRVARARGLKRARVALARKLAVVLHRLWIDGTEFRWIREAAASA